MLVIPAIDIKEGKVVRLFKGDYLLEKVYSSDPIDVAYRWRKLGARRIHIVDLDGAREGIPKNKRVIKEIVRFLDIEIEVGGGIREEETISDYLDSKVSYCVIGTKAYLEPDWFKRVLKKFGQKIIIALDIYNGQVRIKGWQESLEKDIIQYLSDFASVGLRTVIYTDISRDGTLSGVNLNSFRQFLKNIEKLDLDVIFSGGVGSYEDLNKIKNLNNEKIFGIIVGKALYEAKIDFKKFKGGRL